MILLRYSLRPFYRCMLCFLSALCVVSVIILPCSWQFKLLGFFLLTLHFAWAWSYSKGFGEFDLGEGAHGFYGSFPEGRMEWLSPLPSSIVSRVCLVLRFQREASDKACVLWLFRRQVSDRIYRHLARRILCL